MSERWPGGLISPTAPNPPNSYNTTKANGVWTLDQAAYLQSQNLWPNPNSDQYFNYNTLLLNGDGTNGSQNNTFLDSSTNNFTITRNGNTTQGSFSPYGSLWSNYFPGTSYLNTATNGTVFAMGTGDYTIEGWGFKSDSTDDVGLFGTEATGIRLYWYSGNLTHQCGLNSGGGSGVSVSETVPSLNTWFHWACVRSSGTIRLYINGVSTTSTGSATANINSTYMTIGRELVNYTNFYWVGNISNVRAVKGTAVYTSNFTPSTTPLTAISGTSLLTCQSNRFIDNSSNAFAITINGTPSVQRFSPFNPTAPYSTSVIGGSGYFPSGSGSDNLSISSDTALRISSGVDFTLQAYVYLNGYNGCIFGQNSKSYLIVTDSSTIIFNGDTDSQITFSGTGVNLYQWNHIAITRASGNVKCFVNGVQFGSTATSQTNTYFYSLTTLYIGSLSTGGYLQNGFMADININNTTALYTTTFTPPTLPISPVSGTALLLGCTNAGIPDLAMQNNLQTVGSAQVSTSVKKYGTGSLSFNGTTDYLTTISKPSVQLGSGNFTIEFWIYYTSISGYKTPLCSGFSSTGDWLFQTGNGDGKMNIYISGTDIMSESTGASTNTWYHYALVRNGSTITLYNNGTSVASATNTVNLNSASSLTIGGTNLNSGQYFAGYIDDLRITNGYARYTANFTPPTAALPTY